MKIAFVANTSWNIFNFRKGLVHAFLEKGHEVIVLAPEDAYTSRIQQWGIQWIDTPLDGTGTSPSRDLQYARRLFTIFNTERPDVALSFTIKSNIYASLTGRLTRVPTICNVSGLGTVFLVNGLAGKVAMRLYRIAFRFSNHIFFQNKDDQELFNEHVPVSRSKQSLVPGSGVDLSSFNYVPLSPNENVKVLMIARIIVEKGVREYAAASAALKGTGISFTLVGRFDQGHARSIKAAELEAWTKEGQLIYYPHSDRIRELIATHDVVVLPSYREGTPRTLLESAAMGRPLLATNVPGCKEVIVDGVNGFLFQPKSVSSLVDKIKRLNALSFEERKEMGKKSRQLVEQRFDEKRVIDAYTHVIYRIMK